MKHTEGRVLIEIDLSLKNSHTFDDGTKIILERDVENLNKRETMPVNAVVVSGEDLPTGAQVLIHHNSIHDTNKVFISRETKVSYYSIPLLECYLWREDISKEWKPIKGFETALRVYEPYEGTLEGMQPTKIKDILYITSGKLKGKVVHTLKASDYEIVYQGDNGKEERKIRVRHFAGEENEREEIIAIDKYLTKKVKNSLLLVGLSSNNAKKIQDYA